MPKEVQIPPSSPLVNQGLENFRSRMEWIAGFCAGKKIPLLICSPVSNLRSQSPWSNSELSSTLKEIEEQIKAPLSEATSAVYLLELQKQCAAHADDAILHYRLAQCQEWMGNHDDAYHSFLRARDLDQCRYRAPSTFGEALREIANRHPSDVTFVALEPVFREASAGGTPGDELFLEHVHFTIDGHWLMARSIAKPVVENLLGKTWDPTRLPSDSERDQWLGIIPEDRLVGLYLASFIGEAPPFNQALDAKEHVAALKSKIDALEKSLSPEQLKRFHSLGNNVKTDDLIDGLGRIQLGQNEPAEALEYFERSIRRRPWMPNGYFFYAAASQMMGKTEQARDYLQKSKTTVMGETIRLQNDRERLELMMRRSGVR
jgi:tetratricopeptide (TPR) repeat protein